MYSCVTWSPGAWHYDTLRRAHHSFLTCCICWRKNNRTDHPIFYLDTLMKTGSESIIEAIMRRRRILFAGFVACMKNTKLPKCVMFGKLVGTQEDVSVGVHILSVVEQSSLETCSYICIVLDSTFSSRKKKSPTSGEKSSVHQIRLHGRRGKGTVESFSRENLRQAPQKEGGEILCDPGWYVQKPDVQNKWDDNTHRQVALHS